MKKYFEIVAKCGHVGKRKYYEGTFYISAEDGKIAADVVRGIPRVKHDHKYAILSVTKIDEEEYLLGIEKGRNNPYFLCDSQQEQKMYWEEISQFVKDEPVIYDEKEDLRQERRLSNAYYKMRRDKQMLRSYRNCYDDYFVA